MFSRALGKLPSSLINSDSIGINSKRRKIPLTFIPPSTKSPLFVYNNDFDERSFLSLHSGSRNSVINDNESVSTFRSLPSTLEHENEDMESIHRWIEEELERRSIASETDFIVGSSNNTNYGGISNNNDDEYDDDDDDDTNNIMTQANMLYNDHESFTSSLNSKEGIVDSDDEDFQHEIATPIKESKKLLKYSIPLIITFFLEQIFSLVCVVFVGHLGTQELAAVSMSSMTSAIILAIFEGISTSLDTLCPQAYGAGQFAQVGIHTQRCCLFSLVLFIPAAIFWWFSGFFLKFVIDDDEVVRLSQLFLRILILGAPAYILFENSKRFLQAQGIFEAGTIILFITAPLNILLNWLLIYSETFGLGYIGAPISTVINFWLMFILLVLYVMFVDGEECWYGFSAEALTHWYDLSLLAIPGIVMLLAESLAYEVLTLLASYFGTEALATQSALSSLVSLLYMIPFAISVASSTRVANFVGSANIPAAKIATKVGLYASVIAALVNSAIILFGSRTIATIFSDDPIIIKLIMDLCPLISVFVLFDALACVTSGILRALALQVIGGTLSFVGYYAVAVPLAFLLAFKFDMELLGLWLGNGAGLLLIGISQLYVIYYANWNNIVEQAKLRTGAAEYD
ncbi:hypothetical protein CANARDRAFT_200590 [[Candida] arabinofermentans NRRL YB-2248]|uniref:Uncharacterized protein n=1 Tax=[Candida] arabinofermentans NRRL YB-2248 TaxID=983967 RepID=A0A1E4SYG2_9ASCO|nr:hypothetical protein CANARDRAFT_200590 [[Candida] arabinofermentans NRRL YB-2248]